MNTSLISAIDSWILLNDPTHSKNLANFNDSLNLSVIQPIGPPGSVASGGLLVGNDRDNVLQNSKELKEKLNTPAGLDQFIKCPMDGCTSLLNMARVASGYNPALMGVETDPIKKAQADAKNLASYNEYINRVMKAPFFNLELSDSKTITKTSSDWNALVDDIASLYEGIIKEDLDSIKKSLVTITKAAMSRQGSLETANLFTQSVLGAINNGTEAYYTVNIYSSHVAMVSNSSKGGSSTQSDFEIRRTKLKFRTSDWPNFAEKVYKKHVTAVDDWLETNISPTGDTQVNSCLVS